ncbi:10773_t:CDS:1, partial [Acaulospora morrowiae]
GNEDLDKNKSSEIPVFFDRKKARHAQPLDLITEIDLSPSRSFLTDSEPSQIRERMSRVK